MELNREQIIMALECCTRGRKSKDDRPCLECPYNECNLVGGTGERQTTGTCQGWLMKDALALIKELTEENEKLRTIIAKANENTTEYVKMLKEIKFAVEKFKNNILLTLHSELNAELLKVARCQKADEPNMRSQEVFDILDRKIKEMMEDQENVK